MNESYFLQQHLRYFFFQIRGILLRVFLKIIINGIDGMIKSGMNMTPNTEIPVGGRGKKNNEKYCNTQKQSVTVEEN